MTEEDWEWYYYETNPSPFDGLVVWCKSLYCPYVLPYHETRWRKARPEDHEWYRKNGGFAGYCPKHWAIIKSLETEQEKDMDE